MNDYDDDVVDEFEGICRRTHDLPGLLAQAESDRPPRLDDVKELVDFGSLALGIPESQGGLEMGPIGIAATGLVAGRYLVPLHFTNAMFVAAPVLAGGTDAVVGALLDDLVGAKISAGVGFSTVDTVGLAPASGIAQVAWVPDAAELLVIAEPRRLTVHRLDDSWDLADVAGLDLGQGLQLIIARRGNIEPAHAVDGRAAARIWQLWQLALCAQVLGCAAFSLQQSVDHAKQREQFGVPIASFQAVAHLLADMYVSVSGGESMLSRTAHLLEAGDPQAATELASLAHWLPARARKVCEQAIHIHGGSGFTWEVGLHLYYRRVLTAQALLGGDRGSARRVAQRYLRSPGERPASDPARGGA